MKEYFYVLDMEDEKPIVILAPDIFTAAEIYKQILIGRGYSENEINFHQLIKENDDDER